MSVPIGARLEIRTRLDEAKKHLDKENERSVRALLRAVRLFADMISLAGHDRRWLSLQAVRMLEPDELDAAIPLLRDEFREQDRDDDIEAWMEVGTTLTYALTRRARLR